MRCASFSPRPGQNQAAIAGRDRRRVDLAAVGDLPRRPELLEILEVARGERRRRDGDDDVLLARPRIDRPVRRARPHRGAVAHDVLVVHEVGDAGDRLRRERERLDRTPARWSAAAGRAAPRSGSRRCTRGGSRRRGRSRPWNASRTIAPVGSGRLRS